MKSLILMCMLITGVACMGQINPKKHKKEAPTSKTTKRQNRNVIIDQTVSVKVKEGKTTTTVKVKSQNPKVRGNPNMGVSPDDPNAISVPVGSWKNGNNSYLYITQISPTEIFFVAEQKTVDPDWTFVGKGVMQQPGIYQMEYVNTKSTSVPTKKIWKMGNKLFTGDFGFSNQSNKWKPTPAPSARKKSDHSTNATNSSVTVGSNPNGDKLPGIYTNPEKQLFWEVTSVSNKIYMVGEDKNGKMLFAGIGTRKKEPGTAKLTEASILEVDMVDLTKPKGIKTKYTFGWKKQSGFYYYYSRDCYYKQGGMSSKYVADPSGTFNIECPDGLLKGVDFRMLNYSDGTVVAKDLKYTPKKSPYQHKCDTNFGDKDGDGHKNHACGGDDCDDNNANIHPMAIEIADAEGIDEDCQGQTIGNLDKDNDGFIDSRVFNKDKNGRITKQGKDCDDSDPSVNPTSPEICDGKDNNCNGQVDEGVTQKFYEDKDGDLYGNPKKYLYACTKPNGYVDNNRDCDDSNSAKTTNCK